MDHTIVKEEWIEDDPKQTLESQLSGDHHTVKCGEILLRVKARRFTFICAVCTSHFESFDHFGQHIIHHIENDKTWSAESIRQDESSDDSISSPQQTPSPDQANDDETEAPIHLEIAEQDDSKAKPIGSPYSVPELVPDQSSVETKKFKCLKCGLGYKHYQSLQKHMRNHHAKDKLPCRLCNGTFWSLKALRLHEKDEHQLLNNSLHPVNTEEYEEKQECPICEDTLDDRRSLLIHVRRKHGVAALDEHFTKKDEMKYPCKYCEIAFIQAGHLESHEKNHWMELLNDYTNEAEGSNATCIFCNKISSDLQELRLHVKIDHGLDSIITDELTCRYCLKTFPTKVACNKHIEKGHSGSNKFQCPHCPKLKLKSATSQAEHIFKHTGERPFKCSKCPKGFINPLRLDVHTQTHIRIKNRQCSYCPKTFATSTEKKRHEQVHTGVRPYQCEECGTQFQSWAKLKEHSNKHRNIKQFKCDICDKSFFLKKTLIGHQAVHSTERPFSCEICGQSFPRKRALRLHEQLHSDVKKYVCNVCGKAFAQPAGLYCHKKTHSNVE